MQVHGGEGVNRALVKNMGSHTIGLDRGRGGGMIHAMKKSLGLSCVAIAFVAAGCGGSSTGVVTKYPANGTTMERFKSGAFKEGCRHEHVESAEQFICKDNTVTVTVGAGNHEVVRCSSGSDEDCAQFVDELYEQGM